MKILLLGATGRTGKHILEYAIAEGYEVQCLVRNPKKITPYKEGTIIEGNPIHMEDLRTALKGCSCIVNALNISRVSDFPWSKLRTPSDYISKVMNNSIICASESNITRIVSCSAWGVSESRKNIPKWFKWLIDFSNIGIAYRDHERQESLLQQSDMDWTIVRPVGLSNSKKLAGIKVSFNNVPTPSLTISRLNVAKYMVDSIQNSTLIRKTIVISHE